jgi:hypothetical protein
MYDDLVLTKLLRQDRAIVIAGAAAIALLGWTYLFYQGWAMQHMDLVAMAMPSTGAWGSHGPVTGLRNVGGDDGRHDGSVGYPHAAGLCYDQPQPVRTGKGVRSPVDVPRGLSGIVDGFQPRRRAGTVGTAQPSADFPHDGRHQPLAR